MPSIFLETTIPSYLTAWRSPELVMAARQEITRAWWDTRRQDFDLYISQVVLDEAGAGDPDAAARRLELLEGIPLLKRQPGTDDLSNELPAARQITSRPRPLLTPRIELR